MEGIIGGIVWGILVGSLLGWWLHAQWDKRGRRHQSTAPGTWQKRRLVDWQGNEVRVRLPLTEDKMRRFARHVGAKRKLTFDCLIENEVMTRTDWKNSRAYLHSRGCLTYGPRGEGIPTHRLLDLLREELNG